MFGLFGFVFILARESKVHLITVVLESHGSLVYCLQGNAQQG